MSDYAKGLRRLAISGLVFVNICGANAVPAATLSLEAATQRALAENPGLAAMYAKTQALVQLPQQVQALPDPDLSMNLLNLPVDSGDFTQEAMTQLQIGVSQRFPYPGKRQLRGQAAEQRARAGTAMYDEMKLQLATQVKSLWWNLFYLDRALDVTQRNSELLKQVFNVAETRYEVGQGEQQDILLARMELSKLNDQAIRLRQMRHNEVSGLNVLLNQPAEQGVTLAATIDEKLPKLPAGDSLRQRALQLRPILSAQQYQVNAAKSGLVLARKDYAPDFKLGVSYGLRDGSNPDGSDRADLASVMFSMNLPLFTSDKQDRAVAQHNSLWREQQYQLKEQRNQVSAQVNRAINDYQHHSQQVTLFRTEFIPQARQTVDSLLAGYQVGKTGFLNLIRSQTTLYDYETQYWKAFSAAWQALARLSAAVGEENLYE